VRHEVEAVAAAGPLSRSHLWLAFAPSGLHTGVWRVVSLAALNAMDAGRRKMWSLHYRNLELRPDPRQTTLINWLASANPDSALLHHAAQTLEPWRAAAVVAVAALWEELTDFTGVGCVPPAWSALGAVPADHPFLHVMSVGDATRVCVTPRTL
jgi:hypothetical protein